MVKALQVRQYFQLKVKATHVIHTNKNLAKMQNENNKHFHCVSSHNCDQKFAKVSIVLIDNPRKCRVDMMQQMES